MLIDIAIKIKFHPQKITAYTVAISDSYSYSYCSIPATGLYYRKLMVRVARHAKNVLLSVLTLSLLTDWLLMSVFCCSFAFILFRFGTCISCKISTSQCGECCKQVYWNEEKITETKITAYEYVYVCMHK